MTPSIDRLSAGSSAADTALLDLLRALHEADYAFITVSPASHARVNARADNGQARSIADIFGWSRPFAAEQLPPRMFDLARQAGIVVEQDGLWRSTLRVSSLDGELFLHSAYPTVADDAVFFGPDTYRFARAVEHITFPLAERTKRVVDVGCGAGPAGIMIAKRCPDAEVLLVDINHSALRLSAINARGAKADNAVARESDLLKNVDGNFDLIVANPPYLVDPLLRAYRHGGGALGAALSLSILETVVRLNPGGTLLLYTGVAIVDGKDPFKALAGARLAKPGISWTYEEIDPDVFGEELESGVYAIADRIAAVALVATRSG